MIDAVHMLMRNAALSTLLLAASVFAFDGPGKQQAPPPPSAQTGTGVIAGRVIDAATNKPVTNAVVAIGKGVPARRVLTDDGGRYFFANLPKGSFTLGASKPGWMDGAFGSHRPQGPGRDLDLVDGDRRADVNILMWRYATISGTVRDEADEPVVDLDVRAVRRTLVAGRRQLSFAGIARTDDRGVYRLSNLLPGEYLVMVPASVTSEPITFADAPRAPNDIMPIEYLETMTSVGAAPMSISTERGGVMTTDERAFVSSLIGMTGPPPGDGAWLAYPTSFFGSSSGVSGARVITLESGQDRTAADIHLRFVPTYQVSGVLNGPDGPAANHALHLLPADSADFPLFDVGTAISDAHGVFTFYGVPSGQYVIRVVRTSKPAPGERLGLGYLADGIPQVMTFSDSRSDGPVPLPTEPLLYASEAVGVAEASVGDLVVTMRPGPRVSGSVVFEGSAPQPIAEQWQGMRVSFEPANGRPQQFVRPGQFTADGQFSTPSLPPGPCFIRIGGAPPGWTFKSAMYQGKDVSDAPLDLSSVDVHGVLITFTDRPTKIEGTARFDAGSTDTDPVVLLFPVDPRGWADYGANSRRVRSARASSTGTYSFIGPPPGEYFLIAIPDEQSADWQDPAFLEKLAANADRIQVNDGGIVTRDVKGQRIK